MRLRACGWREQATFLLLSVWGLRAAASFVALPVGMAPLFEGAAFAPVFQSKFRLKAFDDGKLRCYLDTAAGTQEVAARFRGLTKTQFHSLISFIEQFPTSQNQTLNSAAVSHADFQSAFDCCFEKALGRKPSRKLAAIHQQHATATSNEKSHSHRSRSPPSPSSKAPPMRSSVRA